MEPEELQISLTLCTIALVGLFLLQRLCYSPYTMVLGSWHQLPFLPCQGHVLHPSLMLLPCPLPGSPALELEKPDPVRLVALVILLSCSLNSSHEVGGLGDTRRAEPFPSPPLAQHFPRSTLSLCPGVSFHGCCGLNVSVSLTPPLPHSRVVGV